MSNPRIVQATLRFRNALLAKETQASKRLATAYGQAYQRLTYQIKELEKDIVALAAAGKKPTDAQTIKLERYQSLLSQTTTEMDQFAGLLENEVAALRQQAINDAAVHSQRLVQMSLPGNLSSASRAQIMASFNHLPVEAIQSILGALSEDSPLADLLATFGSDASKGIGDAIVEGIAQGYNPRKVASKIRETMGGNLTRALTISRTETLRAYRSATLANYQANSDVVKGWVWTTAKSTRSCLACLALDGKEFPLSQRFQKSHCNCRCSPRPRTVTYADLGLKTKEPPSTYQTAGQWFEKLSDTEKRGMMSGKAFDAYKAGRVTLQDFIGVRRSAEWGPAYVEKPISQILGE